MAEKSIRSTRFIGASRARKGVHGSRDQSGLGTYDSCSKIRRFGRVSCHFPNRPLETEKKEKSVTAGSAFSPHSLGGTSFLKEWFSCQTLNLFGCLFAMQDAEWVMPLSSRETPIRFIKAVQEGCQESPVQSQLGTYTCHGR